MTSTPRPASFARVAPGRLDTADAPAAVLDQVGAGALLRLRLQDRQQGLCDRDYRAELAGLAAAGCVDDNHYPTEGHLGL